MENKMHYFYVLECADGSYYAGYTNNIEKRIQTHNEGKGAKYTRARRPVVLRYYEQYETKTEAMQAEYRFKQLKRPEKERIVQIGGYGIEESKEL
ncbi:hypothetical protein CYL18_16915 [Pradoshia eiseniae]|uniref:GIY-YIG domain-containing protein n=1 Tax=Pradoshia eiseniae TaxID=2064768 RepID=A0A2S7MVY8_9BACI|nr:GIY-YIG nuclease family protein [Pradoshia eiseniae]PQD93939.1 hypothetical protein CYL18_16915 [Pradoshia eiseniae]